MSHSRRAVMLLVALAALTIMLLNLKGAPPVAAAPTAPLACSGLFFSEYIEGSSNNKTVEIYNGTGAAVSLTGYSVRIYFNGSASAGSTIALTGTVADGDVFVLANSAANATILAQADQTSGSLTYNGDDAVELVNGATTLDVIGQIGVDPGTEWGTGLTSTADNTLRRKTTISAGDPVGSNPFDPSIEWDGFAQDTFDNLGAYSTTACGGGDTAPTVTATTPANGASGVAANANLTVTFSESVNVTGTWFDITCTVSGNHPATFTPTPPATSFTLDPTTNFSAGESCTATIFAAQVSDADAIDPPDNLAANFVWTFTISNEVCGGPITPIYTIQGSTNASPLDGSVVSTQGVVTGDFQGSTRQNGFYIQDATGDGNIATSDGIFVFAPSAIDVAVGDVVRVRGEVDEFNTLTEFTNVTSVLVCSTGAALSPTAVDLPEAVQGELERNEGMLVSIPETMTVSQNFFLGRYGQLTMSAEGRMYNPTNGNNPGNADYNARRVLILDDGLSSQNPSPIPYIGADNTIRAGDTTTGLTGVLDYGLITNDSTTRDFRLQPTLTPTFARTNPRTAAPDPVGSDVRVASFNVLNYFNGDGLGGGFPTSRGASSLAEFVRQRDKIIAAITAIDPDVLGVIEMENDGTAPTSAIQDLVNSLNAATAPGTYAFVTEPAPGTDEIKVSLIYQPATVTPVGGAQNYQVADPVYGPELFDRPPLAQTFSYTGNAGRFTVIVNHFKSKGSCPASPSDPDADYGQGCWNVKRTRQSEELLDFIAALQTSSNDEDVLVIGDLNAYLEEDPIDTLEAGGLLNQLELLVPAPSRYSFVFDGQAGSLDHALTTEALSGQVTGVTEWHINADEPSVIDYNLEFKPQDLYTPTPYRSSDHDPVIIGLALEPLDILLADFRAEAVAEGVRVQWETVSELNNVGFNLLRGLSPDAPTEQLNDALIPSQAPGSGQGFLYEWLDSEVEAGTTYFYWLEDVDTGGNTTRHGPVSATFAPPTAVTVGTVSAQQGSALPLVLAGLLVAGTLAMLVWRRR